MSTIRLAYKLGHIKYLALTNQNDYQIIFYSLRFTITGQTHGSTQGCITLIKPMTIVERQLSVVLRFVSLFCLK